MSQPTLPQDVSILPTSASSSGQPLLFIRPIDATWFPLSGTPSQTARLAADDLCSSPPRSWLPGSRLATGRDCHSACPSRSLPPRETTYQRESYWCALPPPVHRSSICPCLAALYSFLVLLLCCALSCFNGPPLSRITSSACHSKHTKLLTWKCLLASSAPAPRWANCGVLGRAFLPHHPLVEPGWLWSAWVASAKQVWTVSILTWVFFFFWIVKLTSVTNAFIFVTSELQIRQHTAFYFLYLYLHIW